MIEWVLRNSKENVRSHIISKVRIMFLASSFIIFFFFLQWYQLAFFSNFKPCMFFVCLFVLIVQNNWKTFIWQEPEKEVVLFPVIWVKEIPDVLTHLPKGEGWAYHWTLSHRGFTGKTPQGTTPRQEPHNFRNSSEIYLEEFAQVAVLYHCCNLGWNHFLKTLSD